MPLFWISGNFKLRTEPRVVHVIPSGTQKYGKAICFGGGTTKIYVCLKCPRLDFAMWDQLTQQN